MTAVHISLALTGYVSAGGHSQDRHAGSVLGYHASSVPCFGQNDDELRFYVEGSLDGRGGYGLRGTHGAERDQRLVANAVV